MKIQERIKVGKLKCWTVRLSKHGWYDLYSDGGISQTTGKHTIEQIKEIIKQKQNSSVNINFQHISETNPLL
jgi:hypothetical protein